MSQCLVLSWFVESGNKTIGIHVIVYNKMNNINCGSFKYYSSSTSTQDIVQKSKD